MQLALLTEASPVAEAVMARVMAHRLYALGVHIPDEDDARDAYGWIGLVVDHLNALNDTARVLAETEMTGGVPDVSLWTERLEQLAGVCIAGAESAERYASEVAARAAGSLGGE